MYRCVVIALAVALCGCPSKDRTTPAPASGAAVDAAGNIAATAFTVAANAELSRTLPLSDEQDFADARRGLIATDPELRIAAEDGRTIWDMPAYGFVEGAAPASVNPSLWRQAK